MMHFETYRVADISTAYLEESNLDLIGNPIAPGHLAELDPGPGESEGPGSFFYSPPAEEEALMAEYAMEARAFGFSERFLAIMQELFNQKIFYVRFDRDGGEIESMLCYLTTATSLAPRFVGQSEAFLPHASPQVRARSRSRLRSRALRVMDAALSNSARASSKRPSF
jgi:hypothetical protein